MKAIYLVLVTLLLLLIFTTNVSAFKLEDDAPKTYSSVLCKTFTEQGYMGKNINECILVQTVTPVFSVVDKKNGKYVQASPLAIHREFVEVLESLGWNFLFIAPEHGRLFDSVIDLGYGLLVYKDQLKYKRNKGLKIVDYSFKKKPEIQLTFRQDRNPMGIVAHMPIQGHNEYNMLYRGEGKKKYFKKVGERYEKYLKDSNHYK